MKKKSLRIAALCCVAVIILTAVTILFTGRQYDAYINNMFGSDKITVEFTNEGIVENTGHSTKNGFTRISFRSIKPGKTTAHATIHSEANEYDYTTIMLEFSVLPTGVLYLTGYDFGGWQYLVLGIALLTLMLFTFFTLQYRKRKKMQFFSYKTVLDFALIFYFGLQGIMFSGLSVMSFLMPERAGSWQVYNLAGFIMSAIFVLSIPLIVIYAAFLSVSNISLIKHEGLRKNNIYGLLISAALVLGSIICIIAVIRNPNSTGLTSAEIRDAVTRSVLSSAFVYFECILLSTQICTFYASRHVPKYNQDFIIILGCKTRKDGTPLPLLKGRIDKAISFFKAQTKQTGKTPVFIPSGGQGSDEIMPEAQSMKNYLVENGIDEKLIMPETESATTLENMRFSKIIADEQKQNANILFTTTNYHVFRSGILSAKAGMRADGIGAKTKWYFWPNAQMREFIGLLAEEWRLNIIFVSLSVLISVVIANIPAIISSIVK